MREGVCERDREEGRGRGSWVVCEGLIVLGSASSPRLPAGCSKRRWRESPGDGSQVQLCLRRKQRTGCGTCSSTARLWARAGGWQVPWREGPWEDPAGKAVLSTQRATGCPPHSAGDKGGFPGMPGCQGEGGGTRTEAGPPWLPRDRPPAWCERRSPLQPPLLRPRHRAASAAPGEKP